MTSFELRQYSLLFLTAVLWGTGFIGQKLGMDHVEPFTFTFMRTLIGGLFLLPVMAAMNGIKRKRGITVRRSDKKNLMLGSLCCGTCLICAESFQQFGIQISDVTSTSFITSLYVVFVPIFGIFIGSRPSPKLVLCVAISVAGLYLLTASGGLHFSKGNLLTLIGAMCFAVHILVIAYFVARVDGVALSCGQFFVASFLGFIMMVATGGDTLENFMKAAPAFIYCGIVSNGIAYTLQVVGQRGVNPIIATIIMSLESVMGTFFGIVLLGESPTTVQLIGCALVFTAVILAQVPVAALARKAGFIKSKA